MPSTAEQEPTIRPLASESDYAACLALQHRTWGAGFSEAVPASILRVAQKVGGVAAGAFDAEGVMLGFVFGITGVRAGRIVHWSDLLAVREDARNRGIGRLLKEHQRRAVREVGAEAILWSFDPLVARNANLNLNRLGARAVEYVVDMYGASDSVLHRGLGTDRLIVEWAVEDAPRPDGEASGEAEVEVEIEIEVPRDIAAIQAVSLQAAAAWRARTRPLFVEGFARALEVVRFECAEGGPCRYLLARRTGR